MLTTIPPSQCTKSKSFGESPNGAFHCLWEETVLQSVCPGSDRSASLPRGQEGEQVMSGVSGVLNNTAGFLLESARVNVSERV